MAIKSVSDVTVGLNITSLPNAGSATVGILTGGNDSNYHVYKYNSIDSVIDFDANSSVYKLLAAGFNTDNFDGVLEVIVAPSADVTTSSSSSANTSGTASATPTSSGANVTTGNTTTNRFVYALKQVIDDGFNYVVDDNLSTSDIEAVTDYLYQTQKAAFITQVSSISALSTLSAYSIANHPKTSGLLNGFFAMVETSSRKPAIQTASYLAQFNQSTGGLDAMKVGDLSEFLPDDDLSYEDLQIIKSLRGSAIADKADMNMQLTGYALAGNYLDEFVNTKIVKDRFQYNMQRALNNQNTRSYTQSTIDFLYTIAVNTGNDLYNEGFLGAVPSITKPVLAQVSNADIANRHLSGFNIQAPINNSIETMKLQINLEE